MSFRSLKLIFALLAVILLYGADNSLASVHRDVWRCVFLSLPERLVLEDIDSITSAYLLKQTHEPVFRREDGQNYTSKILSSWSRDILFTRYEFCPNASLDFGDGRFFSGAIFEDFLRRITPRYSRDGRISRRGECSAVEFPASEPGYLFFLSKYSNAPSLPGKVSDVGLGAYKVEEVSKGRISLIRKTRVNNGYNRIEVLPYLEIPETQLKELQITDFNMLSSFHQPKWISEEYRAFDNVQLRAVSLAISHPVRDVRRTVYDCLDLDAFRKAAVPGRTDFYDIKTLLPVGVPGAEGGMPVQNCRPGRKFSGIELFFANHKADNRELLEAVFDKFLALAGIKIRIMQLSPKELERLFRKPGKRPYNLVVSVAGNPEAEAEVFLSAYAGKDVAVDYIPSYARTDYEKLRCEADPERKRVIARGLALKLALDGVALPLYQTRSRIFYPKEIKNLYVGRGFFEAPDIAEFRW